MIENIKFANRMMHNVIERVSLRKSTGIEYDITAVSKELNDRAYGLHKGKLTIIGGRPSNGKTALMVDMAYNLAKQGKQVAFISLEMEAIDITERLMSRGLEINNREFYNGYMLTRLQNTIYQTRINELDKVMENMVITQNIAFTFKELNEVVEKYLETYDVIFIDYLQMIRGSATAKENMDEYIKHLRALAISKQKVIILGSQINRVGASEQNKERYPTLSDLKGTGAIEEVADVVILVHWQYFYTKKAEDFKKYKIILAKNRVTGETDFIDCAFHANIYKFGEYYEDTATT